MSETSINSEMNASSVYENTEREHQVQIAESINEIPGTHFGRESCVLVKDNQINGVIKWIGLTDIGIIVGIETDEPIKFDNSAHCEIHQILKTPFNVKKDRVIYVYSNEIEDDPRNKKTLGTRNRKTYSHQRSVYEDIKREHEEFYAEPLNEIPGTHFGRESCVMVKTNLINGVIKWIGLTNNGIVVGIKTDEPIKSDNSANFEIHKKLKTPFNVKKDRVIYAYSNEIEDDPRYKKTLGYSHHSSIECEEQIPKYTPFPGKPALPPRQIFHSADLEYICGSFKGIQGQNNSSYLDSSLFSMFAFTSIFDSLLNKEIKETEFPGYDFQRIFRDEIVNPLRIKGFVPWNPVMKLRSILEKRESGYTKEEKDPEKFLNMLFVEMFKAKPFLKFNSGQGSFVYQLLVEKDKRLTFPTVQQLFDQSFTSSNVKLTEIPSCLIIQMPRFGNKYKMYSRILPSHVLDITNIMANLLRQCTICGQRADRECVDCFNTANEVSLEKSTFCGDCFIVFHKHNERRLHKKVKKINYSSELTDPFKSVRSVKRMFMELFAVVCIETSHYVSYVKTGSGPNAPWCLFNSVADRKGGINGYNIPKLTSVEEISQRFGLCDAYLCMYQRNDLKK